MSNGNPMTINQLMKHLNDDKGIAISGSEQKRRFMNMSYYHGYKGYRYINSPSKRVPYTSFDQLTAVYDFDSQLKALFYPWVMQIETAVKNYVLDVLLSLSKSENFIDIYNTQLNNYKMFSTTGRSFKSAEERKKAQDKFEHELKKRLDLRDRIYKIQTDAYGKGNKIASHYLQNDINLPIWAIFELFSLGEFGHFVSCLNEPCRVQISQNLGIRPSNDTTGKIPQKLIYATKDLRNAIAHNDVVFDTRFKQSSIDTQVSNTITNETGITNITFNTITDYLILIIYQLKLLHIPQAKMQGIVSSFEKATESLRNSIPISIFNQIIHTDNRTKLTLLKKYITQP